VLKGGIVGCGQVAHISYIPVFRTLDEVQIVAVCDKKRSLAVEIARRWGIPKSYVEFSHMLRKEDLDFVAICSPPQTHSQLSIQAIEAGLHVLVEKPMAISASEADEMVSVSKKKKVKLCCVHNFLFSPVLQKAMHLVGTGVIGDLLTVTVTILTGKAALSRQDHWGHSLPGGLFGEFTPHAIYLLSAFMGDIHSVQAVTKKHCNFHWVKADELMVLLEGTKGLGKIAISFNSPRTSFTMNILGTKRSLHINNFTMTMIQQKSGAHRIRDFVIQDFKLSLQITAGAVSCLAKRLLGLKWYQIGHREIIERFIESIINDTKCPVTGEDARKTIRTFENIWKQIGSHTNTP
jgi:predicted dehydrogenase